MSGEDYSVDDLLEGCLYFNTASLHRMISKLAEKEFNKIGLSPSHAFIILYAIDHPGVNQNTLCDHLDLQPSTMTRFLDSLERDELIYRQVNGRDRLIYTTEKGNKKKKQIREAWQRLYFAYNEILSEPFASELSKNLHFSSKKLKSTI